MRICTWLLLAGALAACGDVRATPDDGGRDAITPHPIDAGDPPSDAGVDAGPDAPPPPPGQELTGGGGHLRGATFAMDVELGHPFAQAPAAGATFELAPSPPINP